MRTCTERTVYLPDCLVTILSDHVTMHLAQADPDSWLFTVGDNPIYDNDLEHLQPPVANRS